jgi:hypothetical protein
MGLAENEKIEIIESEDGTNYLITATLNSTEGKWGLWIEYYY